MAKKSQTVKAVLYKPKKLGSQKGTKIEMEHTPRRRDAKVIAGGHEHGTPVEKGNKNYYNDKTGLPAMEKKLSKTKSKRKSK
jgi:hypothetical protein